MVFCFVFLFLFFLYLSFLLLKRNMEDGMNCAGDEDDEENRSLKDAEE